MNVNGSPGGVDQLLREAAAQQQAQQAQLQVLQQVLQHPVLSRRVNVSMCAVAADGGEKVLLVALPTGERWEIPMNAQICRAIGRALLADADEAAEGVAESD